MSKGVKAIIASIILLFLLALVFAEAKVLFIATFGGIVVLLGLWIEHDAEKEEKREYLSNFTDEARRPKFKGKVGFWVLMAGIGIEILVAGYEAIHSEVELRHIRKIAEQSDPLEKPIVYVSATLRLLVRGDIHAYRVPKDHFDGRSTMIFVRGHSISNGLSGPLVLRAGANDFAIMNNLDTQDDPFDREISVRFEMTKDPVLRRIVGSPYDVRAGVFNEVGALIVELPSMGTNILITAGEVTLEVNSSLVWKFPIPPQRQGPTGYPPTEELPNGGFGFISSKITTNAANNVEASVLAFLVGDWAIPARWTNVYFDGK